MGLVGSLDSPEKEDGFLKYEGEGFKLFVQRGVLRELSDSGGLKFHFGMYGWCLAKLEQAGE